MVTAYEGKARLRRCVQVGRCDRSREEGSTDRCVRMEAEDELNTEDFFFF